MFIQTDGPAFCEPCQIDDGLDYCVESSVGQHRHLFSHFLSIRSDALSSVGESFALPYLKMVEKLGVAEVDRVERVGEAFAPHNT